MTMNDSNITVFLSKGLFLIFEKSIWKYKLALKCV